MAALVRRHRATVLFSVPTFYARLVNCEDRGAWQSLRSAVSAGETLTVVLAERIRGPSAARCWTVSAPPGWARRRPPRDRGRAVPASGRHRGGRGGPAGRVGRVPPQTFVVPAPGAGPHDEVAAELMGLAHANLAAYKVPGPSGSSEALPRTPTGKLRRFVLRSGNWPPPAAS